MKYKATLDSFSKLITAISIALFSVITYMIYNDIQENITDRQQVFKLTLVIIATIGIVIFCFAFMPTGYKIAENKLYILRPLINASYDLSSITAIEKVEKNHLKGTIRSFGVGGLFGYFGKFYNMKIGKMTFYATRRDQGILIRMGDGKILFITPDETDQFISELKSSR